MREDPPSEIRILPMIGYPNLFTVGSVVGVAVGAELLTLKNTVGALFCIVLIAMACVMEPLSGVDFGAMLLAISPGPFLAIEHDASSRGMKNG